MIPSRKLEENPKKCVKCSSSWFHVLISFRYRASFYLKATPDKKTSLKWFPCLVKEKKKPLKVNSKNAAEISLEKQKKP